jgi:type IV pilus assembly protein PilC
VPLVDALDPVAGASGNVVFYNAVMQIKEDVSSGSQLNFDAYDQRIVAGGSDGRVGEESGNLDGMLDKVADYQGIVEVDNAVDNLTTLMVFSMIIVVPLRWLAT